MNKSISKNSANTNILSKVKNGKSKKVIILGVVLVSVLVVGLIAFRLSQPDPACTPIPLINKILTQYPNVERWETKLEPHRLGNPRCYEDIYFKSTDPQEKIFDFYRSKLLNNGWTISQDGSIVGYPTTNKLETTGAYINFTKGNIIIGLTYDPHTQDINPANPTDDTYWANYTILIETETDKEVHCDFC